MRLYRFTAVAPSSGSVSSGWIIAAMACGICHNVYKSFHCHFWSTLYSMILYHCFVFSLSVLVCLCWYPYIFIDVLPCTLMFLCEVRAIKISYSHSYYSYCSPLYGFDPLGSCCVWIPYRLFVLKDGSDQSLISMLQHLAVPNLILRQWLLKKLTSCFSSRPIHQLYITSPYEKILTMF